MQENAQDQQVDEAIPQAENVQENNGNETATNTAEKELDELKGKFAELNDKFLRQVAEFENYKRRNAKERIELLQTAGKEVITDLLEVLDDSERAQKQIDASSDVEQIKEGISLVFSKLRKKLTGKGLKPMDDKVKPFDPDVHEAIAEIEAGDEMKGKVIDEVQKGYYLNDKIIRYAKVVVGK